jgi:hypothetical protein
MGMEVSHGYHAESHDRAGARQGSVGKVFRAHKAALAAGGSDNGAPGVRKEYHPNYYGAFIIDPDGNNIEAVCHNPA